LLKNTYLKNTHININDLQEASDYWTNSRINSHYKNCSSIPCTLFSHQERRAFSVLFKEIGSWCCFFPQRKLFWWRYWIFCLIRNHLSTASPKSLQRRALWTPGLVEGCAGSPYPVQHTELP